MFSCMMAFIISNIMSRFDLVGGRLNELHDAAVVVMVQFLDYLFLDQFLHYSLHGCANNCQQMY